MRDPNFDYDGKLQEYLKERFGIKTEIIRKNWHRLPSGSIIYQINSENYGNGYLDGFFDLNKDDGKEYQYLIEADNRYLAVVLRQGDKLLTDKVAVIPKWKLKELYDSVETLDDGRLMPKLKPYSGGYTLRSDRDNRPAGDVHRIDQFFGKWDQIVDFSDKSYEAKNINDDSMLRQNVPTKQPDPSMLENSEEEMKVEHDFAQRLKRYLEKEYSISIDDGPGRAHLTLPSGTIIHVRGSNKTKKDTGFTSLYQEDYKEAAGSEKHFLTIVYERPETTVVLPKTKMQEIFGTIEPRTSKRMTENREDKPHWNFDIGEENGRHFIKLQGQSFVHYVDDYVNKWDQIEDFKKPAKGSQDIEESHWIKDLVDTFMKLGGRGKYYHLSDIYIAFAEIRKSRNESLPKDYENIIRYYLQLNSRGSRRDLFQPKEIGSGYWMLKEVSTSDSEPSSELKDWTSLNPKEIEEIVDSVLNGNGKRLEIERDVVRRIINHLIAGKNVILVGPPGTGKTDLAGRLLKKLGLLIYGTEDFVAAVASYEWGRFEVIGGNSLKTDSGGNYIFHLGCVLTALNENKMLFIDEFNRADMNKAFGEMFRAVDHGRIELREDEVPPESLIANNEQHLPSNVITIPSRFRMICTMNDYDKSILNELSYGLLRRFAFVEVNGPKDKESVKRIVKERVVADLQTLDVKDVEAILSKMENDLLDKFVSFILQIRDKRSLGTSTLIDVVRYVVVGAITRTENDYWKLLGEALVDYVLPQLDRLDSTTLIAVRDATDLFKSDKMPDSIEPFINSLNGMIKKIQSVGELFDK